MKFKVVNFLSPMKRSYLLVFSVITLASAMFYFMFLVAPIASLCIAAIIPSAIFMKEFISRMSANNFEIKDLGNSNKDHIEFSKIVDEVIDESKAQNPNFLKNKKVKVHLVDDSKGNDIGDLILNSVLSYNVFAFDGFFKTKTIISSLSAYNVLKKDPNALKAVVAHELKHLNANHVKIMSVFNAFTLAIFCLVTYAAFRNVNFLVRPLNITFKYRKLAIVTAYFTKSFLDSGLSRMIEHDADQHPVELGYAKEISRGVGKLTLLMTEAAKGKVIKNDNEDEVLKNCKQQISEDLVNNSKLTRPLSAFMDLFATHPSNRARALHNAYHEEQVNLNKTDVSFASSITQSVAHTAWSTIDSNLWTSKLGAEEFFKSDPQVNVI
ncbi:MAG: M48 family metalloprotease [Alphaproteobacteria bacterium]|nr:M48 family metalloprotease [Alphaproteobacteria bacterium]OJV16014.1 MAG: hypothetical protein BGO27_04110 [Alphaproteobacteria bacterium 33-17]